VSASRRLRAAIAGALVAAVAFSTVGAQARTVGEAPDPPRFLRISTNVARESELVDPAKDSLLSRRISADLHDVSRGDALREIGLTAGIQFVYAGDILPRGGIVRLQSANITVADALVEVLAGTDVDVAVTASTNLILVPRHAANVRAFSGTLSASINGMPVQGAVVQLLDTLQAARAAGRSDADGRFVLRARGPGPFRLRIQRIGVRPYESPAFAMHSDTTSTIALDALPVSLPRVLSTAISGCHDQSLEAHATSELWEDVRTALLETVLTYAEQHSQFELVQVKRIFDPRPGLLRAIAMREDTLIAAQPWTSFAPDILAEHGYVALAGERLTFVAPDLEVLLSRSFENTHCFGPSRLRDGALIGLSFEPSKTLAKHPDIAGTFWVDAASHELRRLTFHHTGLPFAMDDSSSASTLTFAKFDAVDWFIPSWVIRAPIPVLNTTRSVPVAEQFQIFTDQVGGRESRAFSWLIGGVEEQRGDVLSVYRQRGATDSGAVWTGATGGIRVSIATRAPQSGAPAQSVEGAEVLLIGSSRQRVSDESGTAAFDHLTSGLYKLEVNSQLNAQFGEPPEFIEVRVTPNAVATASVVMKSRRELVVAHCGADTSGNVIVGSVVRDRVPVPGASLDLYDVATDRQIPLGSFRADSSGRFVICVGRYASEHFEMRSHAKGELDASSAVRFGHDRNFETIELNLVHRKVP
jgi:carboxypeptidase family protein